MTSKLKIGLTAAAAAVAVTAAGATLHAGAGGMHGPMKHFDADNDGAVSLAEARTGAAKMFAGADADQDGRVTHDEMRAFHGRMGDHHGGKPRGGHGGHSGKGGHGGKGAGGEAGGPMHLDSDGDGAITLAEIRTGIDAHFARIDADRNGSITEAEMRAAHSAHHGGGR
jgi:hypothetical protein